jgi:serine/threonine-protein kinase
MRRFRMTGIAHRGGMGVVRRGVDLRDGSPIAMKTIAPHHAGRPEVVLRFAAEIDALRSLDVPGIPHLVASGVDETGAHFLVMEWLAGHTLPEIVRREGRPSVSRALEIGAGILERLAAMHECGWVHGDVQPRNVLVDEAEVALVDLGLARRIGGVSRRSAEVYGTPAYLAPEVLAGDPPSVGSDLYAVGVLLCELVGGATPCHDMTPVQIIERHRAEPSGRQGGRKPGSELGAILARATAKHPEERYLSALGMRDALLASPQAWRRRSADAVTPRGLQRDEVLEGLGRDHAE